MKEGNVIEVTIQHEGYPIKIRSGKVFAPAFGTTYYNHSMHWSWIEVPVEKLSHSVYEKIKQYL
jgi:hypothetical protein